MELTKCKLGELITQRREKNDGSDLPICGVSKDGLIPPKQKDADTSIYNVFYRDDFIFNPARMELNSIAINDMYDRAICSSLYEVFYVHRTDLLLPHYLELIIRQKWFTRYCKFLGQGSAREYCRFGNISEIEIEFPPIEEQQKIVEYNTAIENRIALKQKINDNLEATSLTIFKEKVANNSEISTTISLNDACVQITDGKHGDCESQDNSGYYFISVKDISNGCVAYNNARQITECDFIDAHKRTKLEAGDILFTNSGTLGRMCLVPSNDFTDKTTFQKSVAILKPDKEKISSTFLYLSLAYYKDKLIEFAHGSAQKNLLLSDMRNFEIKYPSQISIKEFDYLIQPIFTKIQQNNDEIVSLKILSKVLLAEIVASSR